MFALPVEDISWIEGASQYSRVHARTGEYLLSRSLSSLQGELDPARFFRIRRSAIVNAANVREVMSRGVGRYNAYLQGGEALPLGRGRRDTLHRLLGGGDLAGIHRARGKTGRVRHPALVEDRAVAGGHLYPVLLAHAIESEPELLVVQRQRPSKNRDVRVRSQKGL